MLRCVNESDECAGIVEYKITPDRNDFKSFPRCAEHFEKRLEEAENNLELMSDIPPTWFD